MTQLYVLLGVVIVPYHFLSFKSFWVEGELRKHYIYCILYRISLWTWKNLARTQQSQQDSVYLHENLVLLQGRHS
jgi:hypothetical protein